MSNDLDEITERFNHCEAEYARAAKDTHDYFVRAFEFRKVGDGPVTFQVRMTEGVPVAVKSRIGGTIHEIRACLDSLACRLAERNSKSPAATYFPISKNRKAFEEDGLQKIKKLSDADKQAIIDMTPNGQDRPFLFGMHEFDRVQKHQRLNAAMPVDDGVQIGSGGGIAAIQWVKKYGVILNQDWQTILEIDFAGDLQLGFRKFLAFEEPAPLRGMNVLDGVGRFLAEARQIVHAFR